MSVVAALVTSASGDLQQVAQEASLGLLGDLDAQEILLESVPLGQPPFFLAGVGLLISVLCGLTFARQVQNRLEGWKQDRLALLPLGSGDVIASYSALVIGVTLFIGGSLQVFGFGGGTALLVALLLSLLTGGALWVQLERLMAQVQDGSFRAVDFDNFDQFF